MELLEKLAVLIPSPRAQLLRVHGVLAPHAAWRSQVVPRDVDGVDHGAAAAGSAAGAAALPGVPPGAPAPSDATGFSWAALLRRVFAFDVLQCPRWGGRRRIVGVHTRRDRRQPLLARLGLDGAAATRPSRPPPALAR